MLLTKSVQVAKEKNQKSIDYIELFMFISHGTKKLKLKLFLFFLVQYTF